MNGFSILQAVQAAGLATMATGFVAVTAYDRRDQRRRIARRMARWAPSASAPPAVSLVMVARDRGAEIVSAVEACLALDYPTFEVVVVNEGSTDATMRLLDEAYRLRGVAPRERGAVATQAVHGVYAAEHRPRLRVVDKAVGGPTDALAAGMNEARYERVLPVDVDAPPEAATLRRMLASDARTTARRTAAPPPRRLASR